MESPMILLLVIGICYLFTPLSLYTLSVPCLHLTLIPLTTGGFKSG
jgi:hypothetical protein